VKKRKPVVAWAVICPDVTINHGGTDYFAKLSPSRRFVHLRKNAARVWALDQDHFCPKGKGHRLVKLVEQRRKA
jgi:hypothetical protein